MKSRCLGSLMMLLMQIAVAAPSDAFFPLNQAIAILADSARGEALAKEVNEVRELSRKLENRFSAAGIDVPDDYSKTLQFDAKLLREAARGNGGQSDVALVREVIEDLRAKRLAAESKGMGANTGMFSPLIGVAITTKSNGSVANGYLVYCNPRRFAEATTAMFVFVKPTSPTSYAMPPGKYVCSVTQGGNVRARQEVPVGLTGNSSEDVIILLP